MGRVTTAIFFGLMKTYNKFCDIHIFRGHLQFTVTKVGIVHPVFFFQIFSWKVVLIIFSKKSKLKWRK